MGKNGIEDYEIIPVRINEDFIPCMADHEKKKEMLFCLDKISLPIREDKIDKKWWFEKIAYEHLRGNMESWVIRIKKYGIRHILRCLRWLVSPFVIKCYFGLLRQKVKRHD